MKNNAELHNSIQYAMKWKSFVKATEIGLGAKGHLQAAKYHQSGEHDKVAFKSYIFLNIYANQTKL